MSITKEVTGKIDLNNGIRNSTPKYMNYTHTVEIENDGEIEMGKSTPPINGKVDGNEFMGWSSRYNIKGMKPSEWDAIEKLVSEIEWQQFIDYKEKFRNIRGSIRPDDENLPAPTGFHYQQVPPRLILGVYLCDSSGKIRRMTQETFDDGHFHKFIEGAYALCGNEIVKGTFFYGVLE